MPLAPPPSNYPRPIEPKPPKTPTGAERYLGCGCVFVPAGLFLLAILFGLMLAEGPQPDGRIGQEPGRGLKVLVALGAVVLCGGLGARWLGGRPRTAGAAARMLLGVILLAGSAQQSLIEGSALAGVVLGLSVLLILRAFVRDGRR